MMTIPLSPLGLPIDVVDDCDCTAYGFCGDEHRDAFFGQVEHEAEALYVEEATDTRTGGA